MERQQRGQPDNSFKPAVENVSRSLHPAGTESHFLNRHYRKRSSPYAEVKYFINSPFPYSERVFEAMPSDLADSWLVAQIPANWRDELSGHLQTDSFRDLIEFVEQEYEQETIYPPRDNVLSALALTPLENTQVVIVGQDPYHGPDQAHGLAFSVQPEVPLPPSLKNIVKEMHSDIGCAPPPHGCLTYWAMQGVLLLNTVLTVRAGHANSHRRKGWEELTDAMLAAVSRSRSHVVFVLWGNAAKKKSALIDSRHTIISSAHPSPLSARNGFFGSRPFSQINAALEDHGQKPIDWDWSKSH